MRIWFLFLFTAIYFPVQGAILFLDPAGGRCFSGKFFTSQATIQRGDPSAVEIVYSGNELHITLISRRFAGWQALSRGSADDDTAMFSAETAEVFLMPENSPDYYQLALNPDGRLYSARRRDKSWNPRIKTSVRILPDRWTAEFIIPIAELGADTPREGTVWKVNFAVSVYDGNIRKQASWSPTESFHNIDGFGTLRFTSEPFCGIKSWHIKNNQLNVEFVIPEKSSARGSCTVDGVCHDAVDGKAAVTLGGKEIGPKNFSIADIRITDRGKVLLSERHTVPRQGRNAFNPDRFYVTADRNINYSLELPAPVNIQIHRAGTLLGELKNVPQKGTISLADIPPGKITLTAFSQKDETFSRRTMIITGCNISAPPLPNGDMVIDGKILRTNGIPVFPVGTTGSSRWHLTGKENFSLDLGTVNIMKNAPVLRQLPLHRLIRKPSTGYLWKNDWQTQLDKAVAAAPRNRLHRICYEVQMDTYVNQNGKLTRLETAGFIPLVYREIKKKYPEKIFTLQCDHREDIHLYADHCDILEAASWGSSYAENMLPELQSDMQYIRTTAKNKPVIFWLGVSIPDPESRCAEELRAGVYSAVFNDMAGVIFHLGHGGISAEKQRLWSLLSGINREISQWYASYADGEKVSGIIRDGAVLYRIWKYQSNVFAGVVNTSAASQKFDIRHGKQSISGTIDGYDAVIYTIR